MKSAVWVSRGPETHVLRKKLHKEGYRIVESQRIRSETGACYPKTLDLFVAEVRR